MLGFEGCEEGANRFIERHFFDCVYDRRDYVGFSLGLASILVWLTAQVPQFISNIKNQSSEALSVWFLVQWFAGDTLNLLGCLVQGEQLPTTTILAAYFVLSDVVMLLQYIYYGALQARRERFLAKRKKLLRHHHHQHHQHHNGGLLRDGPADGRLQSLGASSCSAPATPVHAMEAAAQPHTLYPVVDASSAASNVAAAGSSAANVALVAAAGSAAICLTAWVQIGRRANGDAPALHRRLLHAGGSASDWPASFEPTGGLAASQSSLQHRPHHGSSGLRTDDYDGDDASPPCHWINCDWVVVAGTVMGYVSTLCYLSSRVSQLYKNLQRRSTEGLSVLMFLLTITANLFTGCSILLRLRDMEQLKAQLPWVCGTFGTVALDVTLAYQAVAFKKPAPGAHDHGAHGVHNHHHGTHGHAHPHTNGGAGMYEHEHERAVGRRSKLAAASGGVLADAEVPLLRDSARAEE